MGCTAKGWSSCSFSLFTQQTSHWANKIIIPNMNIVFPCTELSRLRLFSHLIWCKDDHLFMSVCSVTSKTRNVYRPDKGLADCEYGKKKEKKAGRPGLNRPGTMEIKSKERGEMHTTQTVQKQTAARRLKFTSVRLNPVTQAPIRRY